MSSDLYSPQDCFLVAPACASTCGSRGEHGRDYQTGSQRRAYTNGHNEGLKNGRSDAQKGRRFEYEQHDGYRVADKGCNRRDGNRGEYRDSFRKDFIRGYSDAYRANAIDNDRRSAIVSASAFLEGVAIRTHQGVL
jgi:hypothetical protein